MKKVSKMCEIKFFYTHTHTYFSDVSFCRCCENKNGNAWQIFINFCPGI